MAVVTVVDDPQALAVTAADRIAAIAARAIAERGSATICFTGGSTPRDVYRQLSTRHVDWTHVHAFWGDERHVPPDHADSNYGMARDALLSHVPIPETQIHRLRGERPDPHVAAEEYEQELRDGFAAAGRMDMTFDLMLLGLGENVHIASIFPGSPLLTGLGIEPTNVRAARMGPPRVAAVWVEELRTWRITLTPPAVLDSHRFLMMVAGEAKADAVRSALEAPDDLTRYPAQLLRPVGDRIEWVIDRAAARRLSSPPA